MRHKFSSAIVLSIIALSASAISAQTWERSDRTDNNQKRKQTIVRTVNGQNGAIVTTSDEIIVRPALRTNLRPTVVRPIPPVPPRPVVRTNVRISDRNNYSGGRTIAVYSSGNYENSRYESSRFDNVAQVARLNGYRDGVGEGAKDARDGDRYDPFGEHAYKDGATGYISKYGDRKAYQQTYRQSFVKGYKESFDRYLGNDKRYW